MARLKQLARPGLVAAIFVLVFMLYSCGPVWTVMFKGISEQQMVGFDPFTRWMAVVILQAVMIYAVVYWTTYRLTRPHETVKSVLDEKTLNK